MCGISQSDNQHVTRECLYLTEIKPTKGAVAEGRHTSPPSRAFKSELRVLRDMLVARGLDAASEEVRRDFSVTLTQKSLKNKMWLLLLLFLPGISFFLIISAMTTIVKSKRKTCAEFKLRRTNKRTTGGGVTFNHCKFLTTDSRISGQKCFHFSVRFRISHCG